MELREIIRKFALKNALGYGKAFAGAVVGKVVAEFPDAKKDMKSTMNAIQEIVGQVNHLTKEQVEEELKKYEFKHKEEGPKVWHLEGAEKGKVVTRFLPEPNGYLHLGHAKAAMLSWEFARQWQGKCKLRFDDTNPETEKLEYANAIQEDLDWLGIGFAGVSFTSDVMPRLQQFGKKLLILGRAYICTCKPEEMNQNRYEKKACACRERKDGEQVMLWQAMVEGKAEKGKMVLRLKGDMQSQNTVMRDPTLFRVIQTPHYRQGEKYQAWPTYDFEVSISDSLEDITHALRSKEYELRDELYYAILNAVNLPKPYVYDFARLNIKGTALSKRFLKPLIEQGKVNDWDDPRLPTLRGLRRRGILPEAIKEFVLGLGLSKQESFPTFEQLLHINRRLLDPVAEHYFFVENPVKLSVYGLQEQRRQSILIPKKGNSKDKRNIGYANSCYVSGTDAASLKEGEVVRLKELFAVKINERKMENREEIVGELASADAQTSKVIQWVSGEEGEAMGCTVIEVGNLLDEKGDFNEDSWKERKGYCEKTCLELKEGQIVQFERVGFCRLDKKEGNQLTFVLSG